MSRNEYVKLRSIGKINNIDIKKCWIWKIGGYNMRYKNVFKIIIGIYIRVKYC